MAEVQLSKNRNDEKGNQYLSFFIKDEMFAVNVFYVREIIQYAQITRVPMMQSCVAGITNIRGAVIPVLDLSDRLGLGTSPIDKKTCIITIEIILDNEKTEMGIIIDSIDQVYDICENQKMDSPEFGSKVRKDFILMIAKVDNKLVTMLELEVILSILELSKPINKK
jgi:purine-binding chemotaxis protein CheW